MTEPFPNTSQNPSERNPLDDPDLFGDSDPLLETGWFIDTEAVTEPMPEPRAENKEAEATEGETTPTAAPGMGSPIMATPVSQRRPKKRAVEDLSEHPSWLPEDWRMDVKVRTSGATAGIADRYFISPTGQRFRSKVEVVHYLETGSKRKNSGKKLTKSDSETTPTGSPSDSKKKKPKSSSKSSAKASARDFSDIKFDFENPPQRVTWVQADDTKDEWVPSAGNTNIPEAEAVRSEWGTVYSRVAQLDKSS